MHTWHWRSVGALVGAALFVVPTLAGATTIEVRDSEEYGQYLVNEAGESLYLFEADQQKSSECSDACAQAWPPVTAEDAPRAQEGVDPEKLGTIERKDGTTQVTYAGKPLYRFVKDREPGQTRGQDVNGFGAEWYLVSPDGEKVTGGGAQETG